MPGDRCCCVLHRNSLRSHSVRRCAFAIVATCLAGLSLLLARQLIRLLLVPGVVLAQVQGILGRIKQVSPLQVLHSSSLVEMVCDVVLACQMTTGS